MMRQSIDYFRGGRVKTTVTRLCDEPGCEQPAGPIRIAGRDLCPKHFAEARKALRPKEPA